MAVVRLILRLSSSRPRPSAAVPALLRLVVGPCLNAHKRHVRDPPPFPITLLGSIRSRLDVVANVCSPRSP